MLCTFIKPDGSKCTANAMHGSKFCCFHNPDVSEEEKNNIRSEAGSISTAVRQEFIEYPLPEMKLENNEDVALLMADTINNMRAGKISRRLGASFTYMAFVLLLALNNTGNNTE